MVFLINNMELRNLLVMERGYSILKKPESATHPNYTYQAITLPPLTHTIGL